MELAFALAVGLLLAGVVGSAVPVVPGAGLSLAGIYLHWWSTGYASPGPAALVAFTLVGLAAMLTDQFAGAVAARVGGASARTTALAAVVSLPLLVVAGPAGLVVGVAGVVFLAEAYRTRDPSRGLRSAAFATVGVLGSAVVQVLLTLSLLVGFLLAVV
ncbi:DUF456 domain-containing protein (plasmid) [Halorussus salilacus]|uniref:DUF456 domain-containing protein n=1 Tax=Halorussus salilacus TaxID=2953750 RepID=UPI00209FEBC3|nr:DUF456 domain-containing protein [Halorussus salilacus]USZ69874.1 DUF456 domain-containing protein [Halorussus salilacus]